MKKLKRREVAVIVFAAISIFGARFLLFADFFIDSKILGVIIIVLWSLYYAVLIIVALKNSERRFAVLSTIIYLILFLALLFTLV